MNVKFLPFPFCSCLDRSFRADYFWWSCKYYAYGSNNMILENMHAVLIDHDLSYIIIM